MTMVTAATLVPASARSSATQATTIAGDGLRPRKRDFTGRPPRVLGFFAFGVAWTPHRLFLPSLVRGLSRAPNVATSCKEPVGRGTASVLAVLAAAGVFATAAAASPKVGFADDMTKYSDDGGAQLLDRLKASGSVENRVAVYWDPAQPSEIQEKAFLDRFLPVAEQKGVRVVFSVYPRSANAFQADT